MMIDTTLLQPSARVMRERRLLQPVARFWRHLSAVGHLWRMLWLPVNLQARPLPTLAVASRSHW